MTINFEKKVKSAIKPFASEVEVVRGSRAGERLMAFIMPEDDDFRVGNRRVEKRSVVMNLASSDAGGLTHDDIIRYKNADYEVVSITDELFGMVRFSLGRITESD